MRWSSSNPNSQNVGKDKGEGIPSLRLPFGPAPGREWVCLDFENIERRIPAYDAGEEAVVALFERPNEPPCYGSEHLLVASILHPKLFAECRNERGEIDGRVFKDRYKATWYQWVKNMNFAIQYGCQEAKADATAHKAGAWKAVKSRFKRQEEMSAHWIAFANRHGHVETLPDRSVDPQRGYPLLLERRGGRVEPTKPLAYRVSGTAMWCTARAMVKCAAQLAAWRAESFDARMVLQVHDELVFDFPKRGKRNLPAVRQLARLMESVGDDLIPRVPLRVAVTWCPESWAKGRSVEELTNAES